MDIMPVQVAIAIFYDTLTDGYLQNSIALINSEHVIECPQEEETKFYILRFEDGKIVVQTHSYETTREKGLTLLGLIRIGSTDKDINLIGDQLVATAPNFGDPELLHDRWAVDMALDYCLSSPCSDVNRAFAHSGVDSLRESFDHKVVNRAVTSPASFHIIRL